MSTLKDKAVDAGKAAVDAVKSAGQRVGTAAEDAVDWVKDKTGIGEKTDCGSTGCNISERMDVIASCGKKVGVVDHVDGRAIKLTRKDSADGQHHFIPMDWVDHVDRHVHLKKNSMETERDWKGNLADCGCAG